LTSGEFSAHDDVLSLAYAFNLGRSLSLGIVGKRIHQKIDEFSASTFAVDFGLLYEISVLEGLRFGAVVQNIGGKMTFIEEGDELPRCMRLALAYETSGLTIAAQIDKAGDSDTAVGVGGEYVIGNTLALRTGYNSSRTLSFGTGVVVKRMTFGYAYAPNDELDASQRISVNITF
jgi:hypothetical protein